MARKAEYRRTSPAPFEDVLQGADLTQFLESYEELCDSVRMAGRWILGRARNERDQRLLTRFRQTLRTAEELLYRAQPSREAEACAFNENAGNSANLIRFPDAQAGARKQR